MNDTKRQILQELEMIIENHTGYVKETKENFKDQFSFKDLKGLLIERKKAFDYKITRMMQTYGYYDTGLRTKLDELWEDISISQPAFKKYIRPVRYVFPINFVIDFIDDTSLLKLQIWRYYTDQTTKLIEATLEEE